MSDSKKTWVIGITDDLAAKRKVEERPAPIQKPLRTALTPARPAVSRTADRPKPKFDSKPKPAQRMHFALKVALTYLLGPFALLLSDEGRQERTWAVSGAVAGVIGIAMIVWRDAVLTFVGSGWAVVLLGLFTLAVVQTWYSAWTRAIVLTRQTDPVARKRDREDLPASLRRPWILGLAGFLVPGLGFLLAGRTRRAAIMLWSSQIAVAAGLTLWHAPWIWRATQHIDVATVDANRLEQLFIASAAVLAVWTVVWIAQSLEGGRQAAHTAGMTGKAHGDRYAIALLGALAALVVTADPDLIAERLGDRALTLQEAGCRVIPLQMSLTAHRLDPSRPVYAMQAMDLYAELGRDEDADRWREKLDTDLRPFVEYAMRDRDESGDTTGGMIVQDGVENPREAQTILAAAVQRLAVAEAAAADSASAPASVQPVEVEPDPDFVARAAFYGTMGVPDPE